MKNKTMEKKDIVVSFADRMEEIANLMESFESDFDFVRPATSTESYLFYWLMCFVEKSDGLLKTISEYKGIRQLH